MRATLLSGRGSAFDYHRVYGFCAKCGEEKPEDRDYVHDHCVYPFKAGAFHFCAVCGQRWDGESRCYVCDTDLVGTD